MAACPWFQAAVQEAAAASGRAEAAEAELGALRRGSEGMRAQLEQSQEESAAQAEQVR